MSSFGPAPDWIAGLYAAATEPDGLERMSSLIREAVRVDSAGIWLTRGAGVLELATTPDVQESWEPYLAHYRAIDPWTPSKPAELGKVTLAAERFSESDLLNSEFYNDFARHYRMLRPMGSTLTLGDGALGMIATNRVAGHALLDESDKARLQVLIPHIQGALRVRLRFSEIRAAATSRSEALDGLAFAVIVCDASGSVLFANRAAERASRTGGPVVLGGRGRGMATARPAESAGLAAHVGAAALGQARAMRLTGPGGDSVPVLVTPCPQAFGPVEEPGRVLLSMAGPMAGEPSAGLLQELYRLSPAQAELCRALATGRTFEAAAQERGVAVSTMRSHFAEILRKTGAGNLRDLLRLLAALPQVRS